MTRKTKRAYVAILKFIEEHVCNLDPVSFMCDFEDALRSALREVYCISDVRGCVFHFVQACRRNAKKIAGFFAGVNADSAQCDVFEKLLSLPLLPADKIVEAFEALKVEAAGFGDAFQKYVAYMEKTWIKRRVSKSSNIIFSDEIFF